MKPHIRRLLYTLLFLLCLMAHPLQAQDDAFQFKFRHYTMENGLPSNCVRTILHDQTGYIWVGTENGLCRFNGLQFVTPLGCDVTVGVYSLLQEGDLIWVGTDKGLYCCDLLTDSIRLAPLTLPDGQPLRSEVTSLNRDCNGVLWISTMGQGVLCRQPGSTTLQQYAMPGNNLLVASLLIDSNQQIWAVSNWNTFSPLARFNQSQRRFEDFTLLDGQGQPRPVSGLVMHQTPDGRLWIGSWDEGLFSFDVRTHQLRTELLAEGNSLSHIHSLMQFDDHHLFVGSDEGMTLFNTQTHQQQHFAEDELSVHSLNNRFIYPIVLDRDGGLWVGSYYGGISYAHPRSSLFTQYVPSRFVNAVSGQVIGHFCEDNHGHIWIASDDGGLSRFDVATQTFTAIPLAPAGQPQRNVHSLSLVGEDLWIGTYTTGIYVLNTRTGAIRHIPELIDQYDNFLGSSCYALFVDDQQQLWVGTFDVICRYNFVTDRFERIHDLQGMTIDIDQDAQGRLWFCTTGNGIWRYDPQLDQWHCYTDASGQNARNVVNAIVFDANGRLWAGSQDGLLLYDAADDVFKRIELSDAKTLDIKSLLSDHDQLWIGSSMGLLCYNPDASSCQLQIFTNGDGLSSIDFLPNAALQASDGRLYFGTSQGINAFYPYQVSVNRLAPSVVFSGLEIYNQSVPVGSELLPRDLNHLDQLDLDYTQNVIALSFAALSYFLPEQNQYAYRLEGFDPDSTWINVGNQNKAIYTHLTPGQYTFRVRACNNDGRWGPVSSLRIVVHPPFYWNTFARIIYLLLLIGALFVLNRYLMRRSNREHARRIRELNEENERQLNESRIHFFTVIAHEIRTPVSLITAPLQKALQRADSLPGEVRHNLAIVERNSQRLLQLVNQLLDYRKYQESSAYTQFRVTPLAELLRGIIVRFEPTLQGSNIQIDTQLPPDDFAPCLDSEAITKLVSNLLNNARKFTHSRITLICQPPAAGQNTFTLTISDDGPGIAPQLQQRIFEPFYQGAENQANPGTGIGLSIVKRVVEHHQGSIRIESQTQAPSFSSFIVTLPCNLPSTDVATPPPSLTSHLSPLTSHLSTPEGLPSLLLVEDNEEMLHFLTESLRGQYQVFTASNGRQALQILAHEAISLVVSDWMMPIMDGSQLCQAIRSNPLTSHILFILLTAKTDDASKVEGMNCGADAYIEKPFSLDYLQACIGNLIRLRQSLIQKYQKQPLAPIQGLSSTPVDTDFLGRLEHLIEQNFSNPDLSVDYLCSQLAISRSGFFAKIKTLADVSPTQMILLVRLKHAAHLLQDGQHSVSEVAYLVGFSSPSYFTKCFAKQFGVPPTEFGKQKAAT